MDMDFFHPRWPVFHADNHLLALYKPAGLLVQGDETGDICLLDLAKQWVKERYRKPGRVFLGLVHRLDRPVAGVMLFARTSKAAARLSDGIRNRRMRKVYLAVVEGRLPADEGRLVHCLERRERSVHIVSPPTPLGREARLIYRVRETAGRRSLVEIELETGRKHQIRLQLAHCGCPIVGDLRYGASEPLFSRQIALLAREICVDHPTRPGTLTLTAPAPAGWPWPMSEPPGRAPFWNWSDYATALREHARPPSAAV